MTKIVTATIQFEVDPTDIRQGVLDEIAQLRVDSVQTERFVWTEEDITVVNVEVKDKPREWKFGDEVTYEQARTLPGKAALIGKDGYAWNAEYVGDAPEDLWPMRLVYLEGVVDASKGVL